MKVSKLKIAGLSLGISLCAGAVSPANAGGMPYDRHMGGYHTAVPVPAPVPVPEYDSGFYVRIDGAYVRSDTSKYKTGDPFNDSSRGDSGLNDFARFGIGAGYRFSRWLRADLTWDIRSDIESRGTNTRTRAITNTAGGIGVNPTILLRDTVRDEFKSDNSTLLVNGYIDIPTASRFTPYVGAGIGFVRHRLWSRSYATSTICIDPLDCDPDTVDDQPAATVLNTSASATAGGYDYALAVAAMVGFSYSWWDHFHLDMGYRWLHLTGTKFVGRNVVGPGVYNVVIPDQNNHELRIGLRWDIF